MKWAGNERWYKGCQHSSQDSEAAGGGQKRRVQQQQQQQADKDERERTRVNIQKVHHLDKNQDNSGSCGALSFRCICQISHNGSKERKKSLLFFDWGACDLNVRHKYIYSSVLKKISGNVYSTLSSPRMCSGKSRMNKQMKTSKGGTFTGFTVKHSRLNVCVIPKGKKIVLVQHLAAMVSTFWRDSDSASITSLRACLCL